MLFCPEGEGDHAEQRLNALFESKGWTLQKDRFTALHAFLSALPLSAGPNTIREMATLGRLRSFLTWSCVNTAPVAAEWKGSRSPLLMLVGRRGLKIGPAEIIGHVRHFEQLASRHSRCSDRPGDRHDQSRRKDSAQDGVPHVS